MMSRPAGHCRACKRQRCSSRGIRMVRSLAIAALLGVAVNAFQVPRVSPRLQNLQASNGEEPNLRAVFPEGGDPNYRSTPPPSTPAVGKEKPGKPPRQRRFRLPVNSPRTRTVVAATIVACVLPRAAHIGPFERSAGFESLENMPSSSCSSSSSSSSSSSAPSSSSRSGVKRQLRVLLGGGRGRGGSLLSPGAGDTAAAAAAAAGGGGGGSAVREYSLPQLPQWPLDWGNPQAPAPLPAPQTTQRQGTSFISQAARQVMPAVVLVETETADDVKAGTDFPLPGSGGDQGDWGSDDGDDDSALPPPLAPLPPPTRKLGQGSGFIYRADGLVITNAHVVRGASKVCVTMTDGSRHQGKVLGSDAFSDLAVLRIRPEKTAARHNGGGHGHGLGILGDTRGAASGDTNDGTGNNPDDAVPFGDRGGGGGGGGGEAAGRAAAAAAAEGGGGGGDEVGEVGAGRELGAGKRAAAAVKAKPAFEYPVVKLGDSDALEAGDWVIAIGSPFGLENSVTLGVCSSSARQVNRIGVKDIKGAMIQTDAAINPGNSGGPLINEFGEVVGINTLMRRNANSIGFAVPVNRMKEIVEDLASGKQVTWSFLGITHKTLSPEMATRWNRDPNSYPDSLPEVWGSLVTHVTPGTAADLAGLKRFDVVRAAGGVEVRSTEDLIEVVDKCKVGDKLALKVQRGGKVLDLEARPQDLGRHQRAIREKRERVELEERARVERELEQRRQQQQQGQGEAFPFPFSFPWEDDE